MRIQLHTTFLSLLILLIGVNGKPHRHHKRDLNEGGVRHSKRQAAYDERNPLAERADSGKVGNRVQLISDGTPVQQVLQIDGKIYIEVKEMIPDPERNGRFQMIKKLIEVEPIGTQSHQQSSGYGATWEGSYGDVRQPISAATFLQNSQEQWYSPAGQIEYPRLVFSSTFGWQEVTREQAATMNIVQQAPRGKNGLYWIEVPYSVSGSVQRTRVALPNKSSDGGRLVEASQIESAEAIRTEDSGNTLVHQKQQAPHEEQEEREEDPAVNDQSLNEEEFVKKVSSIANSPPKFGDEIEISDHYEEDRKAANGDGFLPILGPSEEIAERPLRVGGEQPNETDPTEEKKEEDVGETDTSEIEIPKNELEEERLRLEEEERRKEEEMKMKGESEKSKGDQSIGFSENEKNSQGDLNFIQDGDMGAVVYSGDETGEAGGTGGDSEDSFRSSSKDQTIGAGAEASEHIGEGAVATEEKTIGGGGALSTEERTIGGGSVVSGGSAGSATRGGEASAEASYSSEGEKRVSGGGGSISVTSDGERAQSGYQGAAGSAPCSPFVAQKKIGQTLYWLLRAVPCGKNPLDVPKTFTTNFGQVYQYFGQPELVAFADEVSR